MWKNIYMRFVSARIQIHIHDRHFFYKHTQNNFPQMKILFFVSGFATTTSALSREHSQKENFSTFHTCPIIDKCDSFPILVVSFFSDKKVYRKLIRIFAKLTFYQIEYRMELNNKRKKNKTQT